MIQAFKCISLPGTKDEIYYGYILEHDMEYRKEIGDENNNPIKM